MANAFSCTYAETTLCLDAREEDDDEILARFVSGDDEALSLLLRRHESRLYRIALSYLRNPEDALEVTQDTFVKLCRSASDLPRGTRVGAWLTRVCINAAIDRYRSQRRRWQREESLDAAGDLGFEPRSHAPGADSSLLAREARDRIATGLAALNETQAKIVMLRHVSQLSLEEIAGTLGLRLGTVKSNLHRALLRLKDELSTT